MQILKDEKAQGSAELILIFGGIIVVVIVAGIFYKNYVLGLGDEINNNDLQTVNKNLTDLKDKLS
jgi:uncharacterized protein (UPF0333 family)